MKIFVVYADAGVGHKKAASAIYSALKGRADAEVRLINALDWTNRSFKKVYPRIYIFLVNRLPHLWGFFYYLADNSFVYRYFLSGMRRLLNCSVSRRFQRLLLQEEPDILVSTHFFASEITAALKRKNGLRTKMINVITDYMAHSFWLSKEVDAYIVAASDTEEDLISRGVEMDKINVLGIPVEPLFTESFDRDELSKKLHITEGNFNILIVSGGFGIGPIEELVLSLGWVKAPIHLIVVCGRNEDLYKRLKALIDEIEVDVTVYGYVNNMHQLMEISDLIITKTGGLTVSEALAKGLPIVAISPIPGQETRNCAVLQTRGLCIRVRRAARVKRVVEGLLQNKAKLAKIKRDIAKVARPNAAADIAEFILRGSGFGIRDSGFGVRDSQKKEQPRTENLCQNMPKSL